MLDTATQLRRPRASVPIQGSVRLESQNKAVWLGYWKNANRDSRLYTNGYSTLGWNAWQPPHAPKRALFDPQTDALKKIDLFLMVWRLHASILKSIALGATVP